MENSNDVPQESAPVERKLTFGQKAMGVSFNPSKDPLIDVIKQGYADLADLIDQESAKNPSGEAKALYTLGLRELQKSQMLTVKAATWVD